MATFGRRLKPKRKPGGKNKVESDGSIYTGVFVNVMPGTKLCTAPERFIGLPTKASSRDRDRHKKAKACVNSRFPQSKCSIKKKKKKSTNPHRSLKVKYLLFCVFI